MKARTEIKVLDAIVGTLALLMGAIVLWVAIYGAREIFAAAPLAAAIFLEACLLILAALCLRGSWMWYTL